MLMFAYEPLRIGLASLFLPLHFIADQRGSVSQFPGEAEAELAWPSSVQPQTVCLQGAGLGMIATEARGSCIPPPVGGFAVDLEGIGWFFLSVV